MLADKATPLLHKQYFRYNDIFFHMRLCTMIDILICNNDIVLAGNYKTGDSVS